MVQGVTDAVFRIIQSQKDRSIRRDGGTGGPFCVSAGGGAGAGGITSMMEGRM